MSSHGPPSGAPSGGGAFSGNATGNFTGGPPAGGGGHGPPAHLRAAFIARNAANLANMKYFAAAIAGLMGVFIIFHCLRRGAQMSGIANKGIFAPFHAVSRFARRNLIPHFPGLPSRGHAILTFLFVGINVIIMFTNMDNKTLDIHVNLASRTGWMAVGNMTLAVFLSLKNTPLSLISAWSYERLNILHQLVGYVTVGHVIIHACTYATYFDKIGNIKRLRVDEEIFGMVSAFGMLFLAGSAIVIRRFWYELFYLVHLFFFIVTVIFVGLHQPVVMKKVAIVTCIVGALWLADRLWRFVRLVFYSFNNSVQLHPLPNGATKITLKKGPKHQPGGSHVFLWVPGVRFFEMHPFTLVSAREHEFVVQGYNGFTKDLRKYAEKSPGCTLRCSVEGPYGKFPDPRAFDRVVLVAGGSGATFTTGMAMGMCVENVKESGKECKIAYHWMVKERSYFSWFSKTLQTLSATNKADINLHITQISPPSTADPEKPTVAHSSPRATSPVNEKSAAKEEEAGTTSATAHHENSPSSPTSETNLTEKQPQEQEQNRHSHIHVDATEPEHPISCPGNCGVHEICTLRGINILEGRPDVAAIIRSEIGKATRNERVLVVGCGPKGLMREVRDVTASCIKGDGPGVELHTEQFGW